MRPFIPLWRLWLLLALFQPGAAASAMELDFQETVRLAEQGDAAAAYFVGTMFATGNGAPKDCTRALTWASRAAAKGHPLAQSHLGILLRDGCGQELPPDPIEAYAWLALSAEKGLGFARENLDSLKRDMHPYLLAEAQRRFDSLRASR